MLSRYSPNPVSHCAAGVLGESACFGCRSGIVILFMNFPSGHNGREGKVRRIMRSNKKPPIPHSSQFSDRVCSRELPIEHDPERCIRPEWALIASAAVVGIFQNVPPIDLVVQGVEAKAGFSLRFGMQRRLELLDTIWSC